MPRKITAKSIEKEEAKLKFIGAVNYIIETEGYSGIEINKIADTANLDKRLISIYFGSFEALIEETVKHRNRRPKAENRRNKENTKQKLINAVGKVIQEKGYSGLKIAKIAAAAQVDKKLIYAYFGGVSNLIETYIKRKDYWSTMFGDHVELFLKDNPTLGKEQVIEILGSLFEQFYDSRELQKLILWEISECTPTLRELANKREVIGHELFKLTDADFTGTDIDLRAIIALQIAGIYYLTLHAKTNGRTFCEIDINDKCGKERIQKAIQYLINQCYKEAQIKKSINQ